MNTEWVTFPIKFEGGLIASMGRLEQGILAPGSATSLQNFEVSIDGGYDRIKGYEKFSETALTGSGSVNATIAVENGKCLAVRDGVYYLGTGTSWTSKATAADTAGGRIDYDVYKFGTSEKVVTVDGLNDPAFYDVTAETVTFDTSAPANVEGADWVRVFANHVFFAKDQYLNFTAPYTDTDYNSGNGAGEINIGKPITGLAVFRDELIIFCVDEIKKLVGTDLATFELRDLADSSGCLDGFTIQEVGGDILYLSADGVRYLSATEKINDFALNRASKKIQPLISSMISTNSVFSSCVIPSKAQYRIFAYDTALDSKFSSGFAGTRKLDQTSEGIEWSSLKGFKVNCSHSRQFGTVHRIYFGNDDGYVYIMESSNGFDGANIPTICQTPDMPISDPKIRKTYYKHSLYATTAGAFSVSAGLKFDYLATGVRQPAEFTLSGSSGGGGVYGTSTYNVESYSSPSKELYVNNVVGSSLTVSLRYTETSTNPPFNLNYAVLEYDDKERR